MRGRFWVIFENSARRARHLGPQAGPPDTALWPPGDIILCRVFVCILPSILNIVPARTLSGFCSGFQDAAQDLAPG